MPKQTLSVLPHQFNIYSLDANAAIPPQALKAPLYFIGKTKEELSLVLPDTVTISADISDEGWQALEVLGPLDLSMVGIMVEIGNVLAKAKISIFVVSTFETDYFLVKSHDLPNAVEALTQDGFKVV